MKKKILLYFFVFLFVASFASADNITVGTLLYPDSVNWTYKVIDQINCNNITVNETCVVINGGVYDGEYCHNLTSIYVEDLVLFPGTPITCFTEIDWDQVTVDVGFEWINSTGSVISSGSTTCEDETPCVVDTLSGSYVDNPGDSIFCSVSVNNSFFDFNSNSSSEYVHDVGACDATKQYPVLNITFYDETELDNDTGARIKINVSDVWNLTFNNGFGEVTRSGTFSGNNSYLWCSDVNPATDDVALDIYGQKIVSAEDYVTRVFSIPQANAWEGDNNPITMENLTLIRVANSTTVKFIWQTTEFQSIDGTMIIYRCEENDTRTLIESTLISSGEAFANIELLTTAYSYEVVIDGVKYTDESFTSCHTESSTERNYYVDVAATQTLPVIGLFMVDCYLTKVSNDTVRMTWSENIEDDSDIEACIVAKRRIGSTWTEIYRNCSTSKNGSILRSVPDNGNDYVLYGEITQNDATSICQNQINMFSTSDTSAKFGAIGLLGALILIMSLYLVFAEDGTMMHVAGGFGLTICFVLGIMKVPFMTLSLTIALIAIWIIIGRYTRKREVS